MLVELGDALLKHLLILLEAPDLFVDFQLGGDPVIDLGEGPLFLAQGLPGAVRLVAAGRAREQQAHAERCEPCFCAAAEDQAV